MQVAQVKPCRSNLVFAMFTYCQGSLGCRQLFPTLYSSPVDQLAAFFALSRVLR